MEPAVAERPIIVARGVSKVFHNSERKTPTVALQDISLDVERNRFVALLGPSGCGKTTILNIIAGFESPTTGKVEMDGAEIAGPGPDRGVIFQQPNLFPWLTVLDNVLFGPQVRGEDRAEALDRAHAIIDLVGLRDFASHFPYQISGGMQQRVAYARVLVNKPHVVLADEPFAALDEHTRRKMQRDFEAVFLKSRSTVLFVTHSIEEAIYLADKILIMSRRPGRIIESLDLDLERPRDRTRSDFLALQGRILKILDEQIQDH